MISSLQPSIMLENHECKSTFPKTALSNPFSYDTRRFGMLEVADLHIVDGK